MDSELANLDSLVQMQQESVEAKDAEMRKIRDQIDQVVLFQYAGFDCCFDPHDEVTSETIFSGLLNNYCFSKLVVDLYISRGFGPEPLAYMTN